MLSFLCVVSFADVPAVIVADKIVKVICGVCVLSLLLLVIAPHVAAQSTVIWRLNGIMIHCQRLSLLAGIGLILKAALWKHAEVQPTQYPLRSSFSVLLLFGTLLATRSRSVMTYVFICVVGVYFWKSRARGRILMVVGGALLAAVLIFCMDDVRTVYSRQESNDATLTGRVTVWEKSIEMIALKPWLGSGYTSFSSDLTADFFTEFIAPHAHNTWINVSFELGLIGASMLTAFLLFGLLHLWRVYRREGQVGFAGGLLVFSILCGLTGVVFGGRASPPTCMTLLLVLQELHSYKMKSRNESFTVANVRG
ncbi:hypothetical protein PSDVSF_23570 [Pseudodesulfovibrio sediminis]|uniref:O-antigen ligase-related domain-containing protein n=2 Tax=Pseudodesulfovibrio sediminis TaxID=2810563 RepID=A0ABM7P836_9BACT|nr:hypothetical protein PSDVSF_23570 [Pseudodesulfovibrio sediminis]